MKKTVTICDRCNTVSETEELRFHVGNTPRRVAEESLDDLKMYEVADVCIECCKIVLQRLINSMDTQGQRQMLHDVHQTGVRL